MKLGTITVFNVTFRIEHLMAYAFALSLIYASTVFSCKRITVAEGFQLMGAMLNAKGPVIQREETAVATAAAAGEKAGDGEEEDGGVEGFAQRDRGNWVARLRRTDLTSFYKS